MEFHFWSGVKPKSLTTSGINGTIPNHAKKHMKNDIAVIQNVRMGKLFKLSNCNVVDLVCVVVSIIKHFYTYKTTYLYLILNIKIT
ncbi:hypothetical protein GCM10023311_27450 [Flaviramulus aquimarinus]|uniref:Uncharacterized protein n=1 Tax=Flaviramulus aquimarinus TaxID=1170456 RepID=A0ABP9FE82_9FLAO